VHQVGAPRHHVTGRDRLVGVTSTVVFALVTKSPSGTATTDSGGTVAGCRPFGVNAPSFVLSRIFATASRLPGLVSTSVSAFPVALAPHGLERAGGWAGR
jgi:hypothetical protein